MKDFDIEIENLKSRVEALENKPTYPFNEIFNKMLMDENEQLKKDYERMRFNFEQKCNAIRDLLDEKEKSEQVLKQISTYVSDGCTLCGEKDDCGRCYLNGIEEILALENY